MIGEIAFDSNRVGHRTQRVFHATWCEMNGHVVSLQMHQGQYSAADDATVRHRGRQVRAGLSNQAK